MHRLLFYGGNVKVVWREFEQVKALRSSNRGVCITWIVSLIKFQQKNLKQDFQLYNCCCSYCAAKKYSNFNLDIQQENLRQGNQLMPLSCNEMLRNEIEYIAKGYQTGLSGKYVKGFEQTPLMFIFCPVEANE